MPFEFISNHSEYWKRLQPQFLLSFNFFQYVQEFLGMIKHTQDDLLKRSACLSFDGCFRGRYER